MALRHTIKAIFSRDALIDISNVPTISTLEETYTIPGVKINRFYLCHVVGLDTGLIMESVGIGTAEDTLQLRFVNPTAAGINPALGKTLHVVGV